MLVEGPTEKYSLPYPFNLFNVDINERGISLIDSGGKDHIPFFIKIMSAFGIPFVVLHDEDRNANNYTTYHNGPNGLNKKIEQSLSTNDSVFKMDLDFEGVFQLSQKSILEARNKLNSLTVKSQLPQVIQIAISKLLSI
ncbi:MAG: TOPRIM nucleotidyl transferase/hydrolase domain-containing protein [Candidatus Aminicenantales bacterium]